MRKGLMIGTATERASTETARLFGETVRNGAPPETPGDVAATATTAAP